MVHSAHLVLGRVGMPEVHHLLSVVSDLVWEMKGDVGILAVPLDHGVAVCE